MKNTSPGSNSILCKQLQPSQLTPPLDIIVAEAATFFASKFEERDDELQTLTTLQTSCLVHSTPVVVESEAVVVAFVVVIPGAVVVLAGFVVVFIPIVVVVS